jgi:hypothetical protein
MRRRLTRRFGAQCAMLAVLFGLLSLVAYACPVRNPPAHVTGTHAAMHAAARGTPCAGMTEAPGSPLTNACEVHCSDGVTLPSPRDLPPCALVALPRPTSVPALPAPASHAGRTSLEALQGAPPPALRYCRLLI